MQAPIARIRDGSGVTGSSHRGRTGLLVTGRSPPEHDRVLPRSAICIEAAANTPTKTDERVVPYETTDNNFVEIPSSMTT